MGSKPHRKLPALEIGQYDGGSGHAPSVQDVHVQLRDARSSRLMHARRMRATQLKGLGRLLVEGEQELLDALASDLGKPPVEAHLTEIDIVKHEVDFALLHLSEWMEAHHARVPMMLQPASAKTEPQPKGAALVIGAWNYPVQVLLGPLVGALAAGNVVALKPSELAPATSAVIARLVPRYLDPRAVRVVEGGAGVAAELLELEWDHICFTGSERVGRIVAEAAARHLTPVTLELGGKSPAVVLDGNLHAAARRIAHGKALNAGQTCTAPDYVLAVGQGMEKLPEVIHRAFVRFFGRDASTSRDYGRIVNRKAFDRLVGFIEDAEIDRSVTVIGGRHDAETLYIEPTVLVGVDPASPIMQEEIFGPLLPILRVESLDEAMQFINARPSPLAAYLFSERPRPHSAFEQQVRAGAIAFNVCNLHAGMSTLPFGGVGASGMGNYHGRFGFDTFSQLRPVFSKTALVDTLKIAYPPYRKGKTRVVRSVNLGSASKQKLEVNPGDKPGM
ncbi:aldehyde dehydrogenase family protein [Zhihengliuella salsuginis]|uniref:Aldehyde dehydrogenase n=1 Tax=Zhihengliuella salsuginis TaxID=578222 RepID=A0ABQ3GK70_9MICC|nr:aldehyde dehydrogenase family protein [Zhihengliuella salsuginis]GHD11067.1 aldehyde dehydrogenase [Zhihengliuella salsuginis]